MKKKFYDYCVHCRLAFQDENEWAEHKQEHEAKKKQPPRKKPFDEVEELKRLESGDVPGNFENTEIDQRLKAAEELKTMKHKLNEAGHECSTLDAEQTKKLYEEHFGKKENPDSNGGDVVNPSPEPQKTVTAEELKTMKRKLQESGHECSKLNPEETLALYNQHFGQERQ